MLSRFAEEDCNVAPAVARIIEDTPEGITPVITEHTIHRGYCPRRQKDVEPVVTKAMPGTTFGTHIVGLTSWFHGGLVIPIDQVVDILGYHPRTRLTSGGSIDDWRGLALWRNPNGVVVHAEPDAPRLARRLRAHWDHLFTLMDKPDVSFDNNFAGRRTRPAVILRKSSQPNRSQHGGPPRAHDCPPTPETSRPQSNKVYRRRPPDPTGFGQTPGPARPHHCKRLVSYRHS